MTNKKEKIITLAVLFVCLVLYWALQIKCPVNALLHIPCPGCGMTRACWLLLSGDILGSLQMHPMLFSMPVLLLYYLKDGKLFRNKWINYGILAAIGLGFLANWIYRLVIGFM